MKAFIILIPVFLLVAATEPDLIIFPGAVNRRSRKSELMCTEYANEIKYLNGRKRNTRTTRTIRIGGALIKPIYQEVHTKNSSAGGMVVGGENAQDGEFSQMAAVGFNIDGTLKFICGGSLISKKFVLTAAHCRSADQKILPSIVRLGNLDISKPPRNIHDDVPIDKFIWHRSYKSKVLNDDIGLIKLAREVAFTKFIQPACLSTTENYAPGLKVVATGWGYMETAGPMSKILQKVTLDVMERDKCLEETPIKNSQLCVGVLEGNFFLLTMHDFFMLGDYKLG